MKTAARRGGCEKSCALPFPRLASATLLIWPAFSAPARSRGWINGKGFFSAVRCGLVAQLVEQRPFKPLVAGSSPAQPTTPFHWGIFKIPSKYRTYCTSGRLRFQSNEVQPSAAICQEKQLLGKSPGVLHRRQKTELDALLPAILDKAFKGEL